MTTTTDRVKIIVATHKKYEMPGDPMYLPLHVGAEGKYNSDGTPLDFGYEKDNTGENISSENYCFGTQTGLYWAWKNLDADYIGLVHYRRFFIARPVHQENPLNCILTQEQLLPMLDKYKVFVPRKRRYYIETIYSHYAHTMNQSHLDLAREQISQKCPEYLKAFDRVMKRTYGYMFNMMIMKKELLNDYCTWLFPILFGVKSNIDMTQMSDFEKRFGGRISERLLNVWLEYAIESGKVKQQEVKELKYTEEIHWHKKIVSFLKAKLFHEKYAASF